MRSTVSFLILVSLIWKCMCVPASLNTTKQETDVEVGDSTTTTFSPEVDLESVEISRTTTTDRVTGMATDPSSEEGLNSTSSSISSDVSTTPAEPLEGPASQVDSETEKSPTIPNTPNSSSNHDSSESADEIESEDTDEDSAEFDQKRDGNAVFKKKDKFLAKTPGKLIVKSKKYKNSLFRSVL